MSEALKVPARALKIAGITPYASIDYPGKFSAVAFLQGCPWRCLYCHNPHMQSREFHPDYLHASWDELVALLKRRVGLLDAVVFSGGEPTLDPALFSAMSEVKAMGFLVGLHTSGCYPAHLKDVLGLVDWVGLDVKMVLSDEAAYRHIVGLQGLESAHPAQNVRECLEMLLASGVDFECRTTAHPDYLPEAKILSLAHELAAMGVKKYALQVYRLPPHLELPFKKVGYEYPSASTIDSLRAMFEVFELRRE